MKTDCECSPTKFPHHCKRHGCLKVAEFCRLCKTNRGYFSLWEKGKGPCLNKPRPQRSVGLGDTVEKLTRRLGIKPCAPCAKRRRWLNSLFPYKD
jgi:hypothetical protein